jgi:membrane-anchored protein YejM (alkaline phosphatase superfamily)
MNISKNHEYRAKCVDEETETDVSGGSLTATFELICFAMFGFAVFLSLSFLLSFILLSSYLLLDFVLVA